MSIIDAMMTPCNLVEKTRTPDGSGGFITEFVDGAEFMAVITMDTTLDAKIAEKSGVTSIYTITTNKNVVLDYHDIIKRKSDGKVFRVTSNQQDKISPSVSSLDIAQVSAESWELTS